MKTVAFTGYRPEKMPFAESETDVGYLRFREALSNSIRCLTDYGYTHFFSGMAKGFDMWAAEEVLSFQKNIPELFLTCVIPFSGQASGWTAEEQQRRANILERASSVVTLSEVYKRGCYFARNRYMIDRADLVLCAWDGQKGGTAYTVNYALRHKKTVVRIDPVTVTVDVLQG